METHSRTSWIPVRGLPGGRMRLSTLKVQGEGTIHTVQLTMLPHPHHTGVHRQYGFMSTIATAGLSGLTQITYPADYCGPTAALPAGFFSNCQHLPSIRGPLPVVLATVPGYPAAVRVCTRTRRSSPGCDPQIRGTNWVRGGVRTGPLFHFTVPTTLTPIPYLSSDRIMT